MPTEKQKLGQFGEERVVRDCACPSCKRKRTLIRLPKNFKCADVICDFCGYLAQVKTATKENIAEVPKQVKGAAWKPQLERMKSAIYFPLFLVLTPKNRPEYAIYYLSSDLQLPEMFSPRNPLGPNARRAGWQGFNYQLESVLTSIVRLV